LSDSVIPIVSGLCLGASCFLATTAYSLRNFSRSRLQQICRDRQNPERFGAILKWDEDSLLACELWMVGLFTIGAGLVVWNSWTGEWATGPVAATGGLVLLSGALLGLVAFPWSLSLVIGEWLLYRFWPAILLLTVISRPLLAVCDGINTFLHRVAGHQDPQPDTVDAFAEELQSVVDEGQREGVVEIKHGEMIQRVMDLHEQDVQAVMTPRTDIVFVSVESSFEEARQALIDSGHSRLPVVGESPDDIVGILYARDLLQYARIANLPDSAAGAALPGSLRQLVRDPLYVPETTSIETLLERMKASRTHVAIVLDEYGGVTGLVTLEDLLEEIVGSIEDEFDDQPEEQVHRVDEDTIEIDGRVHVDELNESFGFSLPEDGDYDTIGGFVFSELGRIPAQGEEFRWRDLDFTVLIADKRRIVKLRLHRDRTAVETVEES
jgi:CBS domain containing-hemolysin-like protein